MYELIRAKILRTNKISDKIIKKRRKKFMNKPLEFLSIISCNKNILEVYLAQKNPQLYNDYKNLIYPHKDYKSFNNRAKHALDLLLTLKPFPKFQCIQPKEFESTIKNHFVMRTYISLKYDKDQKLSNVNQDSAGRKNAFSIRFSFSPFPILLGIYEKNKFLSYLTH